MRTLGCGRRSLGGSASSASSLRCPGASLARCQDRALLSLSSFSQGINRTLKKPLKIEDGFVKFDTQFLPKPLFFRKAKNSSASRPQGPAVQVSPPRGHAARCAELAPVHLVRRGRGWQSPASSDSLPRYTQVGEGRSILRKEPGVLGRAQLLQ